MRPIPGFFGLGALLLTLTACPGGEPATERRQAERGGTVVIAEGADMDKPMPLIAETSLDNEINTIIYRPLLAARWENGELVFVTVDRDPTALARSYEYFGPDSASLRYRLVGDALWSDGRPITAHDAVWTLQTRGDPRAASPRQDFNREIREILAEDDSTLVVHFTRRFPDMFFHTAGEVAPRHLYEGTDPAQLRSHSAVVNPVGNLVVSGPFRIAEWRRGERVVLERNPNFRPEAHLDRVVFRIIPEQTTRLVELQTGNVDVAQIPFDQVENLRRQGAIRIERREKRSYEYISYNPRAHDFFRDPEIRRALGLALDVEGIIGGLQMEEWAVPAGGPYSPIFRRLYDPQQQAPLPYDTAEARRILAAKGWQPGADGILRRNGQPFRFTLTTNSENQRRVDIAQIAQQQWRRIGVDARIQLLEFNTVIDRVRRRLHEARVGGWNVPLSADQFQLWGEPDLPLNDVSYDNPEVRRLMQEAIAQPTEEAAAAYWREAAARIVADQPYSWLFYHDFLIGVNDRVQNTRIDTLGAYQNLWEWWIRGAGSEPTAAGRAPAS